MKKAMICWLVLSLLFVGVVQGQLPKKLSEINKLAVTGMDGAMKNPQGTISKVKNATKRAINTLVGVGRKDKVVAIPFPAVLTILKDINNGMETTISRIDIYFQSGKIKSYTVPTSTEPFMLGEPMYREEFLDLILSSLARQFPNTLTYFNGSVQYMDPGATIPEETVDRVEISNLVHTGFIGKEPILDFQNPRVIVDFKNQYLDEVVLRELRIYDIDPEFKKLVLEKGFTWFIANLDKF